jgi:predicted DCC family thiol-disulfide oxidoreductase YuxK
MDGKHIVLYDGVCNLCNSSVRLLLKIDRGKVIQFAHLQSDFSKGLLKKYSANFKKTDSVVLFSNSNLYFKSEAIFEIFHIIDFPWNLFLLLRILPVKFCDRVYDFIANNRYKWFGKKDNCLIPTEDLSKRFID